MISICYFARLSEAVSLKSERIEIPADCHCVDDLVALLCARGEPFASAFSNDTKVLVAINHQMEERQASIRDGDEIAFFPPVTGG